MMIAAAIFMLLPGPATAAEGSPRSAMLLRLRGGSGRWGGARASARAGQRFGDGRHGNAGGGLDVAMLAPLATIVLKKALGVALAFALLGLDRLVSHPPKYVFRSHGLRVKERGSCLRGSAMTAGSGKQS